MPRGVVDDRRTGYGIIQPGAHPEFDKDKKPPKPKTPKGAGPGTKEWGAMEKKIQARREQVKGARIVKKNLGR